MNKSLAPCVHCQDMALAPGTACTSCGRMGLSPFPSLSAPIPGPGDQLLRIPTPVLVDCADTCRDLTHHAPACPNYGSMAVRLEKAGVDLGRLLAKKNTAYGSAFAKAGAFLRLLFPDGIKPEQYDEMLVLCRIFDKLSRLATAPDAFDEDPFTDLAGYGLLGAVLREQRRGAATPPLKTHAK